jgi:hypothetical protein
MWPAMASLARPESVYDRPRQLKSETDMTSVGINLILVMKKE